MLNRDGHHILPALDIEDRAVTSADHIGYDSGGEAASPERQDRAYLRNPEGWRRFSHGDKWESCLQSYLQEEVRLELHQLVAIPRASQVLTRALARRILRDGNSQPRVTVHAANLIAKITAHRP